MFRELTTFPCSSGVDLISAVSPSETAFERKTVGVSSSRIGGRGVDVVARGYCSVEPLPDASRNCR